MMARLIRKYRGGLLRKKTESERIFEEILRDVGVGYIFQAAFFTPRSFYIVDFYIKSPYKLIVEIDGASHFTESQRRCDTEKIRYLRRCGFKLLKFTNEMVREERAKVHRQLCQRLYTLKRRSA